MPTLDQKTVKALTLDGIKNRKGEAVRDWIFFDDDLHGFGVRVRYDLSGVLCKVWCVQYRHDGKQRRQNIGKFPRMNAATARTKAGAWLDKVHGGIDPAVVRGNDRKAEALKFHKAVDLYLARQQSEVRESTLANISLYLSGAYSDRCTASRLPRSRNQTSSNAWMPSRRSRPGGPHRSV